MKSSTRLFDELRAMLDAVDLSPIAWEHVPALHEELYGRRHGRWPENHSGKSFATFAKKNFGSPAEPARYATWLHTKTLAPEDDDKDGAETKTETAAPTRVGAGEDWEERLLRAPKGALLANEANVATILAHHPSWAGVLAFDAFAEAPVTLRPPPWHEDDAPPDLAAGDLTDEDVTRTCTWLQREYKVNARPGMVLPAVMVVARRRVVHPVRDWLRSVTWDRKRRLDRWLVRYAGAEDTPYVRAVAAMTIISAVARVERPGAKVDTVLILEGEQGAGKSRLVRALGGDAWTLETQGELGTKDALQILRRKWIVELSELDSSVAGRPRA